MCQNENWIAPQKLLLSGSAPQKSGMWVGGWSKSCFKDSLQRSKTSGQYFSTRVLGNQFFRILGVPRDLLLIFLINQMGKPDK